MRSLGSVVIAAVLLCASVSARSVQAADADIGKFFGTYEGHTISAQESGLSKRDLNIEITPYEDDGFTVKWSTLLRKPDGKAKSKSFKVSFLPGKRPGIFAAAAKKNLFGHMRPLNPLAGDPYVWASIHGQTLTLRSLHISESGGYEIQVFSRMLTKSGLDTRFERVRDGEVLKVITGTLTRVRR